MNPVTDPITFGGGVVLKRSSLFLKDNELVSSDGFNYSHDGYMEARTPKAKVNTTAYNPIHTIHRYINNVILGDNGNIRSKWDLDGYCDLYTPDDGDFTLLGNVTSDSKFSVCDYEEFTFLVNGSENKAITQGELYDWGVPNPTVPPTGTAGAAGNPDGSYSLYYTYYVRFPNGRTYETGPSPAGTVEPSQEIIEWSNIGICTYSGTGITVWRKLYRYSTLLGGRYLVTTLKDNTTTTYTDENSDADLQLNSLMTTTSYTTPPSRLVGVENYLNRIFGIKGNTLHWTEPFLPFAYESGNSTDVTRDGEDLVVVISWGDQLYLASAKEWKRLQGSDSATWNLRDTFAEVGVTNQHTVKATRYGILGLWHDGIYLFDGSISKNITKNKLGRSFFTDLPDPSVCRAEFDGSRYFFMYGSENSTLDKCLVIDFNTYPELIFYYNDFVPTAYEYHLPTGIRYYGKSDGYQYEDSTGETITTSLQTGDRAAQNIYQRKQTEYLYYDIDTNGKDVTVTIYVDGTAQTPTYTLNTSSRVRKRIKLANHEGYRFSLKIDCADSEGLYIYEPWGIKFIPYGE